jgi:hypothetical protein
VIWTAPGANERQKGHDAAWMVGLALANEDVWT